MESREVLVIGSGVSGCASALALAQKGIPVTLISMSANHSSCGPCILPDQIEKANKHLETLQKSHQSILIEHFKEWALKSLKEGCCVQEGKDQQTLVDILNRLQQQLRQYPHVEWKTDYQLVELITLERHSAKLSDRYRKPTCLGAYLYNTQTGQVEAWLAKETILAVGGASSLYLYSTHSPAACGQGWALAHRAGARLLHLDQTYFHPLALWQKGKACFPLPLELLHIGGKVCAFKQQVLDVVLDDTLSQQFYQVLLRDQAEHLWLDLSEINPLVLKEQFSFIDAYCAYYGFNWTKDPLPVAPAASYTWGGVVVDRWAQTSLNRLRTVGDMACTGMRYQSDYSLMRLLESLAWAQACAEDLSKQLNKFVYYFPELQDHPWHLQQSEKGRQEDWHLLRQIMWSYAGPMRSGVRLQLAEQLLSALGKQPQEDMSMESWQLLCSIQTARLIIRDMQDACTKGTAPHFHLEESLFADKTRVI